VEICVDPQSGPGVKPDSVIRKFMNKSLMVSTAVQTSARFAQTSVVLALIMTVVAGLWLGSAPGVSGRELSPREMIEQGLPPGKTMQNATKSEFLFAVCAAVKKHRRESPQIARVAVAAHREYAGDIVETIIRCATSTEEPDCEFVGAIVAAAVAALPDAASAIADGALAAAPNCADVIQSALEPAAPGEGPAGGFGANPPGGVLPPPGSVGGGGGGVNPQEQPVLVCDNGAQVTVLLSQLTAYLSAHPGSFVGSCQPTPVTNR
jgi:hypothetical protein